MHQAGPVQLLPVETASANESVQPPAKMTAPSALCSSLPSPLEQDNNRISRPACTDGASGLETRPPPSTWHLALGGTQSPP